MPPWNNDPNNPANRGMIDPQTGVPYSMGSSPINPGQGFNPNAIDPTTGQPYPRGNNPTYNSNDPWGNQQYQQQQQQNRPQQTVNPQRPGSPQNGMVGSPNLGVASGLLSSSQAMQDYYRNVLGLNPQVSSWAPVNTPGSSMAVYNQQGASPGPQIPTQVGSGTMNTLLGRDVWNTPAARAQGMQFNAPSGTQSGGAGGAGGPGGIGGGPQREQSPFEQSLQSGVLGLLNNPSGFNPTQEAMLRNRASEPYAFQQQQSGFDTRADAVRRGAASSDADIRDQLNRVNAEGARNQQRASFDVDTSLAGLRREGTLGALGAGNSLLNTQMGDVRSLREMMTLLASLQQQGGQQGLSFLLGGR